MNLSSVLAINEDKEIVSIAQPKRVIPFDWYDALCDHLGRIATEDEQRSFYLGDEDANNVAG